MIMDFPCTLSMWKELLVPTIL